MIFSPKSSYTQQVVRGWHYSIQWLQKKIHQFKSMFKSTHIHRTGSSIKRWNHQLICKIINGFYFTMNDLGAQSWKKPLNL